MSGLAGCSNLRLRMLLHSMQTGSLTLSTASCSRGWPSRFSSCLGLPRFDGEGWWLGQATCSMTSSLVAVSNSSGLM